MNTFADANYPFSGHFLTRGALRYHYLDEGQGDPEEEQRADAERGMQCRHRAPESEVDERQLRRHGGDELLAEEECEAAAEKDHGNAGGDIVDFGKAREARMHGAKQCADRCRRGQAKPR